jgi:hypothetical protein
MWLWLLEPSRAEPPLAIPGGGGEARVSWVGLDGAPTLRVPMRAPGEVVLTARAKLGERETTWVTRAWVTPTDGTAEVRLFVPEAAWLHDAARDFVTDLWVVVDAESRRRTPGVAFLAWPGGRGSAPVVWTEGELEERAPQGVLRAELRVAAVEGEEVRVLPDVGTPTDGAPPAVGAEVDR